MSRSRPVPATPASRRLRALIAITAVAVVLVEAINVTWAEDAGFALGVRSAWALLRVIGFLVLLRAVRYGRPAARPFGLILAVTTVFAVARLAQPRTGSLVPRLPVLIGLLVLAGLCAAVVWQLLWSPAVEAHLSARPPRRHVPGWVLTVRVAALAFAPLLLVPLLVAAGTLGGGRRQSLPVTVALLGIWVAVFLMVSLITPAASFLVLVGRRWARWLVGAVSIAVLVVQPLLCLALLGLDGLIRDGGPMIVCAFIALVALHRSRGQPTWVRPGPTRPPAPRPPSPAGLRRDWPGGAA